MLIAARHLALGFMLLCIGTANAQINVNVAGSALEFDGVDDYVEMGSGASLNLTENFTIEAWVNPGPVAFGSTMRIVSTRSFDTSSGGYGFGILNGELIFTTFGFQDYLTTTGGIAATQGQWIHLAVVFDTNFDATFYRNGQLLQTVAGTAPGAPSIESFQVGKNPEEFLGAEPFLGAIDEVRVWNTALSAGAIGEYWNRQLDEDHPFAASLVGHWPFDEGSGDVTADMSGFDNHGRLGAADGPDAADPQWISSGAGIFQQLPPMPVPGIGLLGSLLLMLLLLATVAKRIRDPR